LRLTLRRVDQKSQEIELRLARPLRDMARILPLFERGVSDVDSGYGIDQIRLEASEVEPLAPQQIRNLGQVGPLGQTQETGKLQSDRLHDLITRLGNRIGLENIIRYLPADSHIPERSFIISPAAYSEPFGGPWPQGNPRPLCIFAPEAISMPEQATPAAPHPLTQPPKRFRWRRMPLMAIRSTGPERIAPEWWLDDDNWRSGLRDYWRVETQQGRRLWMFYTPQNPGWFVQGEFA
jgi:protein ImuB